MDDVKSITEGIAAALSQQTSYAVYTDYHKQHAHFPCFYVELARTGAGEPVLAGIRLRCAAVFR